MQALSSCPETSTPEQIRVRPHPVKLRRSGKLCKFTRHPKALARVVNLELRAATRFVLEVLLTFADKQGRAWLKPRKIVEYAPRSHNVPNYSLPSVLRGLRELRAIGLLEWERRMPLQRPTEAGQRTSQSGFREWRINIAKLLEEAPTAAAAGEAAPTSGTLSAGSITHDRSGSITHDRSSDPLCLSSRDKMGSRAPEPRDGRAAPAQAASETPSAAAATVAIASTAEARIPREAASETPPAAAAARACAPSSRPAAERDESSGGKGEQTRGQRGAPPVVSAAQQLEDLRRLFPGFTTRVTPETPETLPEEQRSSVETDAGAPRSRTD